MSSKREADSGTPFSFFLEGVPYPQPRAIPHWAMRQMYESEKVKPWKRAMRRQLPDHAPSTPLMGPVGVLLKFFCSRPKSHFNRAGKLKANAPAYPTSKHKGSGDVDNFEKTVLDVMTKEGFWIDDIQVVNLQSTKRYARPATKTGVYVEVYLVLK